jgi:hypothetical protein
VQRYNQRQSQIAIQQSIHWQTLELVNVDQVRLHVRDDPG